jgi:hypothetical protein
MTVTPTMFIRATLCGILMCGTPALIADVEVSAHPPERQQPPQAGVAGNPHIIRLLPEQLDTVTAGQTIICRSTGATTGTTTECTLHSPMTVACPANTVNLGLIPFTPVRVCAVPGG